MAGCLHSGTKAKLKSYLVEITADILCQQDEQTAGLPMVDVIRGKAGSKGTGKWTAQQSLDLGVPAPTIQEAVSARYLSGLEEQRQQAVRVLEGAAQPVREGWETLAEDVRRALYCGKLCAYAQGFAILKQGAAEYGWQLDYASIAGLFRGGCIIRAQFLNKIRQAYQEQPDLPNLLLAPYFAQALARYLPAWRRVAGRRRPGRRGLPGPVQRPELLRRPAGPGGHSGAAPGAAGLFWGPHL